MISIDKDCNVHVDCSSSADMCGDFCTLYFEMLRLGEKHGIPWGNTKAQIEKGMRKAEELYVEEKHKDLIERFGMKDEGSGRTDERI